MLQGRLWPLEILFFLPFFPHGTSWGRHQRRQIGRKEKRWAAVRVNPTSRPHQTQKSHLLSRCTQQQCDVTRWWPHHCPRHPASLAPAAPQPCAAESLVGKRERRVKKVSQSQNPSRTEEGEMATGRKNMGKDSKKEGSSGKTKRERKK